MAPVDNEPVTIVMPTLATAARGPYLRKAIDSVLSQAHVRAVPLVVANGDDCDPGMLRWLESNPDIRYLRIAPASMPDALYAGWQAVDTRYCGELDDDDELLPRALELRMRAFAETPDADAVVTDGIVRGAAGDTGGFDDFDCIVADPLRSLVAAAWLLPGAALLRHDRIDASVFADIPPYLEWTYISLRLSLEYQVKFLPDKTVLHHVDLPFSIDRSSAATLARAGSMRRLLALALPPDVRRALQAKQTQAIHNAAVDCLARGQGADAWRWHLRSLTGRGGWRYLSYTRKLLFG
jgi:glycosyltransferase involved in cell wall biosynthesis